MEYRYLGRTGVKVSALCMGTMTFSMECDQALSNRILDCFDAAGGNFIDTADMYNRGRSEEVLGAWLSARPRAQWIVATKVYHDMGGGLNDMGASRGHIVTAVEASLRRLRTDYIDLYQLHNWDWSTEIEETLAALHDLVRAGKIRWIGVSNYAGWQIQKVRDLCDRMGGSRVQCVQPQYSLLCRSTEWEVLPVCREEGLGVVVWSPLRGGWLSGKYRRDMRQAPEDTRVKKTPGKGGAAPWAEQNTEKTWQVLDAVLAIAKETGHSPAQVALRWLLQRPGITGPIVGARTVEQLEDNLGSMGWKLTTDQMDRLTDVSEAPLPYPYDYLADAAKGRLKL
jgi:aryl-alcohol dehydrogenase-like predicted oxidoreductase